MVFLMFIGECRCIFCVEFELSNRKKTLFLSNSSVKPAVFDLFLTILITAYLFSVYFVILYFPHLYTVVCRMSKESMKTKVN